MCVGSRLQNPNIISVERKSMTSWKLEQACPQGFRFWQTSTPSLWAYHASLQIILNDNFKFYYLVSKG